MLFRSTGLRRRTLRETTGGGLGCEMTDPVSTPAFARAQALILQAASLAASPTAAALDECSGFLAQAVEEVRAARQTEDAGNAPWPAFRKDLSLLGQLLAQASAFYEGWARLRDSLSGGYTANGEPAKRFQAARLSLEA